MKGTVLSRSVRASKQLTAMPCLRNITWQLLELLDGFVKLSVGRNRRVTGTVEWLNVKDQCGFIDRSDACDDICFHRASILRNIQQKTRGSMRKG